MIAVFLIVLLCISFMAYRRIQWQKHVEKYKEFYKTPTPFYLPILGNTYMIIGKNILDALKCIIKHGNPVIAYIPHRSYITSDPEEIKIILNHALDKSKEYNHLKGVFENSLLISEASVWKKNRKMLSKGFKQGILDEFVSTFYSKSCILRDILRNKDYDDIYYLFEKYTLDVFCEATLGVKSTILTVKKHEFVNSVMKGQQVLFGRIGNIFKMNDFIFSLLPDGKLCDIYTKQLHNFLQNIIEAKRNNLQKGNDILVNSKGLPVLDLLLQIQDKEKFDDAYLCKEMNLFAGAASDTSAYSMAYLFCMLAIHPHIQQKVYEEVISIVGEEREIDVNDLCKFKYLEMALNESMRLLPTIPIIGRQALTDIDLGTKVIPKDTGILISFINLHRDEKIYPDPLVYDPDRFLPENVEKRHPYSFLPFSGGPRNCIGRKYAQMVMKTTIANVIRNFNIITKYKSVMDLHFKSSIVMSTTHPLDIQFVSRR